MDIHAKLTLAAVSILAVVATMAMRTAADEPTVTIPKPDEVLKTLVRHRPRLVLTDARLEELKALAERDELLARCVREVLAEADRQLKEPPPERKLVGPRLLGVSREVRHRAYTLGLAWRWTGGKAYADKLTTDLLAACRFKDWNPRHFLDVGEMAHAVGVGYDWLYDLLNDTQREAIREGLIRNGMQAGLTAYENNAWWARSRYNWNQVCNFGLTIGALALADTHPQYARQIIPKAVATVPKALAAYAPDGAWPEGPGYWGYATRYTVYGLAALETALGRDFALGRMPGLDEAGWYRIHVTGPTGQAFNYADAGSSRRHNVPSMFYLARRYDQPAFAQWERETLAHRRADARDVIWYVPPVRPAPPAPPLAKRFDGPVQVAFFRTAWDDEDALFAAVKAGFNRVNHANLDLGQFVVEALGVRWVVDLGADNYNLPGYWDTKQGGKRWTYFRLGSLAHNAPVLDGAHQHVAGTAEMTAFGASGPDGLAVVDMTGAYAPKAKSVRRGLRMLDGRSVLVQDELTLAEPAEVAWAIITAAKVKLDGATAELSQDGRLLTMRLLSPAGATWSVASAEQDPPQRSNKGHLRLSTTVNAKKGPLTIAVQLCPHWPDRGPAPAPKLTALNTWPDVK